MSILHSLLGSVVGGVLSARPKRHASALSFLTGSGSGGSAGSFINGTNLLTAAALGWGAYEIWRTRPGAEAPAITSTILPSSSTATISTSTVMPSTKTPPPLAIATPPPLTNAPTFAALDPLRRLVGVLLAAARSDGELGEREYGIILKKAREAGAQDVVAIELAQPTTLERLTADIPDARVRQELYQLAFGVVVADEGESDLERTWLARLAGLLALDAGTVAKLESQVTDGIARSA